jgi:hypothetical protein
MNVPEKRLALVLENLVWRGDLTPEAARKVREEYSHLKELESSQRRVLSEVGGYLGGLFIFVALMILINGRWHHLARLGQFVIFMLVALLLFIASLIIGNPTAARSRLTGLLNAIASTCVTIAIVTFERSGDGSTFLAILAGWVLLVATFFPNRTAFGEIALSGYTFALGTALVILISPHLRNNSYAEAIVLGVMGLCWLLLARREFFTKVIGNAVAMGSLFISGQLLFNTDLRFLSYLLYVATVALAAWLYTRSSAWPLLVGSVLIITVGMGEFVGETLGGSVGAALGLLTSGVLFVVGSIYSFKRVKG